MRRSLLSAAVLISTAASLGTASAQVNGAPAAPSGAPAAAAEHGSSIAGEPASKNEMKAHKKNMAKQGTMVNPHKHTMSNH